MNIRIIIFALALLMLGIILYEPEQVVITEKVAVSDPAPAAVVPQTVPVQVPTQYGTPITVARTPQYGCSGTCTTACPSVVVASACPAGTLCCV